LTQPVDSSRRLLYNHRPLYTVFSVRFACLKISSRCCWRRL